MNINLNLAKTVILVLTLLPTLTAAKEFRINQPVILKSSKAIGVPLHHESTPSYWKHVPNNSRGKVLQLAPTSKWVFIALESGEKAWVTPKYLYPGSPPAPPSELAGPTSPIPPPSIINFHTSTSEEEAMVWASRDGCAQVIKAGGRMAVGSSERLRVGTWNVRWFPYGEPPNRSASSRETDLAWFICTIVWMNLDVLAVEESLATPKAKQAWKTVLVKLKETTGDSWRWTPQRCGEPDSHKIGYLWNTSRTELTQMKSLRAFNVKAHSSGNPCEGGLRPGHYAYVQSRSQPGADFHLIALHLKSGPTVFALEDRHRALNRIDQTAAQFLSKDQDMVILGDFNTMGAGDNASKRSELKYVRRMVAKEMPGFQDLPLVPRCSHYFRGRGGWLDHVLVNQGMEEVQTRSARVTGYCAVSECQRIKGDYPLAYQRLSDHCPVVLEIENQDKD